MLGVCQKYVRLLDHFEFECEWDKKLLTSFIFDKTSFLDSGVVHRWGVFAF